VSSQYRNERVTLDRKVNFLDLARTELLGSLHERKGGPLSALMVTRMPSDYEICIETYMLSAGFKPAND
jgi:hypothetical protein